MKNFENYGRLASLAALTSLCACATAPIPYKEPIRATPPSGEVSMSQAVTILDASGSHAEEFTESKATLESIIAVMPDGQYDAGNIHFGGSDREATGVAPFNRETLASAANGANFLEGTSPLYAVFEEDLEVAIGGGSGRAVVVVISDGLVTDYPGRSGVNELTLEAARQVSSNRPDEVCYHAVQSGNSVEGAEFMRSLASVTACGSYRNASTLGSAAALQDFSRSIFISEAAGAGMSAATPTAADTDGDGVVDSMDECPGTLKGARVDSRGCWILPNLRFAVNGAELEESSTSMLYPEIEVLKANPDVRIRIDGYSDSDGAAAYNQDLSARRAASVRDFFVSQGLEANRFEVKGFGEANPIVPNDSKENKERNRRVELTIID